MEGTIVAMSLVVKNKANSLAYFVDKVGFEKKTDATGPGGYRYVTVGPKGQSLEIALWEVGSSTDPEQKAWSEQWAPARSPPLVLRVPDCQKAYQELSSRGVEFPQPPKEHPWGTVATFRDPDGNLFSISQLKAWEAPK
jgi:predicted enzyme related to lactoylglutathione lyase